MKDGVYEIEFQGAPAFKIVWRGEELQMYWGNKEEATRHLWLLNNPEAADYIFKAESRDPAVPLGDRFEHLKCHYRFQRKRRRKADAVAADS